MVRVLPGNATNFCVPVPFNLATSKVTGNGQDEGSFNEWITTTSDIRCTEEGKERKK